MNWSELYDSAWHHPGVAWLGVAIAAIVLVTRASSLPRSASVALWLILLDTALDAWLTGALSPLDPKGDASRRVSIFFVIAGDGRFFALRERHLAPLGRSWWVVFARAAAWSFVVPVAQAVLLQIWQPPEQRWIFLTYELLQIALLGALAWSQRAQAKAYVRQLTIIFLGQYVLWASCDVVLLQGVGWALGPRLLANAAYYALWPLLAVASAPREEGWR